jgi:uncharacterized protein
VPLNLVFAILLCCVVGLSLGLLGGGGSILALPVLVYVAQLSPHMAIPMSLAIVGSTSLTAAFLHHGSGRVSLRAALLFGGAGMVGAWLGAQFTHLVAARLLLLLFALLMLVVGAWMLAPIASRLVARAEASPRQRPRVVLTLLAGLAVGGLTGFLGVGGGFLVVPALVLFARLPLGYAVGSSLYVIALNSAAGFVGHLGAARPSLGLTAAFTLSAIAGAVVGHRISTRTHPQDLRRAFAWFVTFVGAAIALQALFFPKLAP